VSSLRLPLLFSVVLGTTPAWGQTPPRSPETGLEEVLVTATRRPMPANAIAGTVRLLDRSTIEQQLAISTSLLDGLGTAIPSFSPTRQKLSGFGESFRGREPLFLIDGVPQSNPLRNGSRDGFTIDPAVIERVEVLYGANAIQGVGATGGVINYVTVSPDANEGWGLRYEAGYTADAGSGDDSGGYRAAVTALNDFGAVDLVASVAYEDRGLFYDASGRPIGVDNTQGDLQNSDSLNLFAKVGWEPDADTRLQLMVNAFDLEGQGGYISIDGDRANGLPTTSARGVAPGQAAENRVRTVSLDFERDLHRAGTIKAQAFWQDFESVFGGGVFADFQDPAIDPTGTLFDQSANNSEKYGLKLTYNLAELPIEGLALTTGVDYLRDLTFQELIATGRLWVPETEFQSIAPFVQLEQALLDERLRVSAGLRNEFARLDVDTYETLHSYGPQTVEGGEPDFSELLVNAGLSYDVSEAVTVYAAYSEGFTMPDVGRVLRGVSVPDQSVKTLLSLEPIVADNIEIGASVALGRWRASASYFWSESDLGQRLVPNADGIFSVNRERTEIEGVEIALDFEATRWLSLGANFAALDGRFDSDGDGRVDRDLDGVNIGPDRLNLYAEIRPGDAMSARLQASVLDDRRFDDPGDATDFEGYTLIDLLLGYEFATFGRLDLGIQNLLDEDYIIYYSQSGTTSNARYFAGRGRTVTLRWTGRY
jgi:iron complex outermembrane receptor protein